MKYSGRDIDAVALWEKYVEFPPNMVLDGKYLPLVQCPNPDHDTLKKHFQINVEDGLVHCFAQCGISGTFEKAISMIEGCNDRQSRKIILGYRAKPNSRNVRNAQRSRRGNKPDEIVPDLAFFTYIPAIGLEYLESRGITGSDIARWEIGWDQEDKRIVIPAKDQKGTTRFLIKRAVLSSQYPKYLYYPEGAHKNDLLFGACQIDPRMVRSLGLILVEGSLDAIRLSQCGFSNTCAVLGTGISRSQVEILSRLRPRRVYLMFDRDVSGVRGIEIAQRRLSKYPLFVCRYPKGKADPAELTREEAKRSIERAKSIRSFGINLAERGSVKVG
jgi:DNA primase